MITKLIFSPLPPPLSKFEQLRALMALLEKVDGKPQKPAYTGQSKTKFRDIQALRSKCSVILENHARFLNLDYNCILTFLFIIRVQTR